MTRSKSTFIYATLALTALIQPSCQTGQSSANKGFLSSYANFQSDSNFNNNLTYKGGIEKARGYDKIYLEKVVVLPQADMAEKKISPDDLRRLQQKFRTALQEQIVKSRFTLAYSRGPGILSVRAAIVEITPGNPKMFLASSAPYVGTATAVAGATTGAKFGRGSAKIEAEVIDSVTRERFVGVIAENVGSKLRIVQGMSRWGHIEAAVDRWAARFGKFLEGLTVENQ